MTKFNPENKAILTYGECLGPAMAITEQEDANQYWDAYLEYTKNNMQEASGKYTPEEICRQNLGYYAGYYDNETRERVERLFNSKHPIFGTVSNNITPEQAFEMGKNLANSKQGD